MPSAEVGKPRYWQENTGRIEPAKSATTGTPLQNRALTILERGGGEDLALGVCSTK
jgi:hypothetical protein